MKGFGPVGIAKTPQPIAPPEKMGHSRAVVIEIASVAEFTLSAAEGLLRNDMLAVFLPDAGREAARRLAMTLE